MNSFLNKLLMSIALIAAQLSTSPICCCHHDHPAAAPHVHAHSHGHGHSHDHCDLSHSHDTVPPATCCQDSSDQHPHECHCDQGGLQFVVEQQIRISEFDSLLWLSSTSSLDSIGSIKDKASSDAIQTCPLLANTRTAARAALGVFLL